MATILIVDDSPLTRKFLVLLLGYAHYHLLEAEDGVEALNIIKKESVDLIITDILMPTMDGYELVEKLHKIPTLKNIPVIFYTATYRVEEARVLAESCGVHFVLSKPADPQLILDTVQNALGVAKLAEPLLIPPLKEISPIIGEIKRLKLNKINDLISKNVSGIESIKQNFNQFLEQFEGLVGDKELLLHKVKELSKNLKQVETLSSQLVTMIELNTDLIAETNPKKLLRLFCMGTRRTLKAKYSFLGILNTKGTGLKYFLTSGMSIEEKSKLGFPKNFDGGFIHNILEKHSAVTINNSSNISKSELLPHHPPIKNFLGFPIMTQNHLYGFFYFADKLDGTTFSEGEQQLARSLVSEFSMLYENFELYDALQRHATKLQLAIVERKKVEEELKINNLFFNQFTENLEAIFWRASPKFDKTLYVSPAFTTVWGRSLADVYANSRIWLESVVPEDQTRVKEAMDRLINNEGQKENIEFNITRPDGSIRNIYSQSFQVRNERGKIINLLGIATDITENNRTKKMIETGIKIVNVLKSAPELKIFSTKLLKIFCKSLDADLGFMWMIDPKHRRIRCIDAWGVENMLKSSMIKESFELSFKRGEGLPGQVWENKKSLWIPDLMGDLQFQRKAAVKKANLKSGLAIPINHQNKIYGVIIIYFSRTQEINQELLEMLENLGSLVGDYLSNQQTQDNLLSLSQHDILTGILNYSFFKEKINRKLKSSSQFLPIVLLNIDRFKVINEARGHDFGDHILKEIAQRLAKVKESVCARLGSDEFILILNDIHNFFQLTESLKSIKNIFSLPIIIEKEEIFISMSIGVSVFPEDGNNFNALLQMAEIALQVVKKQGGNNWQLSTSCESSLLPDKLSLEMDLRKAIKEDQLCVYYQPKVSLKTGAIIGFEALVRWQHPKQGLLAPDLFIPLAEETGLIIPLEEWIFREVFQEIKDNAFDVPISINLSIKQFIKQYNLLSYVKSLIKKFDINPELIEFEITESILAKDVESILDFIYPIKKIGVKLSLDDFGTGYSSLQYLQRFSIDRIKIDKSFIENLPENKHNLSLVKAIVSLSHSFEIPVIAEGVETEKQLKCLIQEGCDEIQGYYFSKPVPIEKAKKMIMEKKHLILG